MNCVNKIYQPNLVVRANFIKVFTVNGKQTPCHSRRATVEGRMSVVRTHFDIVNTRHKGGVEVGHKCPRPCQL